jgi:GT2 family glycosyltransferase
MPGEVTVIIPNWNGEARLERVLRSLAGQTHPASRVLVVDNGSTDGSVAAATGQGAEVLPLAYNFGFSRAVNEGVRTSRTEWVAIVNNDVVLDCHWLENLLQACPVDAGYAACRLLNMSQPAVLDGTFDLLARSGCAWRAGNGTPDGAPYDSPRRILFAPFTALLLRRSLFQQVGELDERFESYLEDVDFCLRCALRGIGGVYVPEAVARHEGSATLGAWSPRMVRLISRNQVLMIAKHYPPDWPLRMGRAVLAGQLLWGLLALRHGTGLAWLRGKLEGVRRMQELKPELAPPGVEELLRDSEIEMQSLQRATSQDRYWELYFRWAG